MTRRGTVGLAAVSFMAATLTVAGRAFGSALAGVAGGQGRQSGRRVTLTCKGPHGQGQPRSFSVALPDDGSPRAFAFESDVPYDVSLSQTTDPDGVVTETRKQKKIVTVGVRGYVALRSPGRPDEGVRVEMTTTRLTGMDHFKIGSGAAIDLPQLAQVHLSEVMRPGPADAPATLGLKDGGTLELSWG